MNPERRLAIVAAAILVVVALLLVPLPESWNGAWQGHVQDLGHVPLFAVLTIVVRLTMPLHWSVLTAIALAGLAELVQESVGRSGNWVDFLWGVLGTLAGAVLVRAWAGRRSVTRLTVCSLLIAALVAWPVLDEAPYLIDAAEGYRDFPILSSFKTDRELARWVPWQATFTREGETARLVMLPGPETYPCASLRPVKRDFRGYRWLCCEFATEGEPFELVISIRTGAQAHNPTTHAQVGRVYPPGGHLVRFDLESLGPTADPVPLDLADVRYVQFFVVKPTEPKTVVIRRLWLEP